MRFVNGEQPVRERTTKSRLIWLLGVVFATCPLLFVVPTSSLAQITFERTYGGNYVDYGHSVQQTSDDGYVIGGYTESFGAGGGDIYLVKVDSLGNIFWDTSYGGSSYDCGYSVQQTADGGYIIAGETQSFGAGYYDVYLIKTDSLGNTLWEATYGDTSYESGYSVQETSDGGYIIAGYTRSFGAGQLDAYLVKTDSSGDVLWDRTYGGSDMDRSHSVQQTSDGGYIVAGATRSFGAGSYDVYLIKTDSLGNTLWETTYGDSMDDWGFSVQHTLDGGYVVTGWTESFGAGGLDAYLIKTDSSGNILWQTTYGGSLDDRAYSVHETLDSGYIVTGYTGSFGQDGDDVYLFKTNALGGAVWETTYGDSVDDDYGLSVRQTLDGGYIVAGVTGYFGTTDQDVYLIKTDGNGTVGVSEKEDVRFQTASAILYRNVPNPFDASTVISYSLPAEAEVALEVYDVAGRLVETLISETQGPGMYDVPWDTKDTRSGVYFYRLQAGDFTCTKKMVLLR